MPTSSKKRHRVNTLSLYDEAAAPKKSSLLSYFTPRQPTSATTVRVRSMPSTCSSNSSSSASASSFDASTPVSTDAKIFDAGSPSTMSIESKVERKRSKSKYQLKKSAEQMYLDFGQKNFGQRAICKTCNHLYVIGQPEDEANHKILCSQFQYGIPFAGWKNERVVNKLSSDSRIVEIRSSDASQWLNKVEQVKKIADDEMGFAQSNKPLLEHGEHAFLFIRSKRVIGLCIVQHIEYAYFMGKNNTRSKDKCPASIGIYQIWVHHRHRRSGVAKLMVDTIRRKLLYGTVIPTNMVAFSSPTENGMAFATSYSSSVSPKVYDC